MWRTWLGAIAVIAALLLAFIARDQSSVLQACVRDQQTHYAAQEKVERPSDIVVPFSQRWPIAFQCTGEFLDKNDSAITAISTIIIAIFTIVLAVVTGRQARLTKEVFAADKRAFVFASNLSALWEIDQASGQYCWRLRPVWRNSGETPTRGLMIYTDGELRNTLLPDNFDLTRTTVPPGTGLLGPHTESAGGQSPRVPAAPLTPQDIIDMQNGRKHFYLWGWTVYNDVFPGTPRHITRFCWLALAVGDPMSYNPTAMPG